MKELSDRELIDSFADAGTRNEAFNQLVLQNQERLYRHIRKMVLSHEDTDDLLQNTFLKAYHALGNFREESKLSTWLYRIATNECLNFLKTQRRKILIPFGDAENKVVRQLEADSFYDGDKIAMKLQMALRTLPEKQRLVFNMKYFEDMRYEDISTILGTSVGALKASYHFAVKKIEEFLKRD